MSEDLMQSSLEEQTFWCNCVSGLPGLEGFTGTGYDKFGERIAWGTGPHSLRAFREAFEIIKPKHIFEIGFNMGYASAVFLELDKSCNVFSCDISLKEETIIGAKIMEERYADRFLYCNRNTVYFNNYVYKCRFDLCFVDGNHLEEGVTADINLCLNLKIPHLLFDDILPQFSAAQEVINEYKELELVKEWGNVALYKNTAV